MQQAYRDSDADNDVKNLHFLSASEGYVTFEKWVGYTQDGGKTFSKKYITPANVNYNGYNVNLTFGFDINGVYAFNSNQLFVFGDYGFVPAILSSTDCKSSA